MPDLRRRRWILFCAWGVLLLLPSSCKPAVEKTSTPTAAPSATPTPEGMRSGWNLIWQDEFAGGAIDPANWTFDIGGGGWGNSEREYYTDRPENARVEGGMLIIEARAEKFSHRDYTSARLKTQGLRAFTYGRIEARMQLPFGKGIWPAFWMLGTDIDQESWPGCGEIDIMEHIGREPARIYATAHGPGYSAGGGVGTHFDLPEGTLSNAFHVYAIEWEPEEIRWYVDNDQYFSINPGQVSGEWVFQHPFFIIINLAVGGTWPGYPDETTIFPQFLRVDYVRAYQRPGEAGENQTSPGVMHLGEIALTARENEDGTWQAIADITVVDENGNPVEGAYVDGGWVGAVIRGETKAQTDSSGTVRLVSAPIIGSGEETFCVTGVNHDRYTYDKTANARNCGTVKH
ncbi:MAG: family 16 glycosylhydrolase [Anaerolineales bacterium]